MNPLPDSIHGRATSSGPTLRVRLVPSAVGEDKELFYATSFLINDTLAVDAGCIGFYGGIEGQNRVRHVLLTHTHQDHLASLPILLENTYGHSTDSIEVCASREVIESLHDHVFNDVVWPDLRTWSENGRGFVRFRELAPEESVQLGALTVTPVPVNHTVPTFGFIVESGDAAVVLSGDTGPTERIWELAAQNPRVQAVFLECAFPDALAKLADAAKHLTPALFTRELERVPEGARVIAFHLKPRYREAIERELAVAAGPRAEIGVPGVEYRF